MFMLEQGVTRVSIKGTNESSQCNIIIKQTVNDGFVKPLHAVVDHENGIAVVPFPDGTIIVLYPDEYAVVGVVKE